MYPIVRLLKDAVIASRQPRLAPLDTHVSRHHCWPWDIDIWMELNNGRTLTLYDLGRTMLTLRTGLAGVAANATCGSSSAPPIRERVFKRVIDICQPRSFKVMAVTTTPSGFMYLSSSFTS